MTCHSDEPLRSEEESLAQRPLASAQHERFLAARLSRRGAAEARRATRLGMTPLRTFLETSYARF